MAEPNRLLDVVNAVSIAVNRLLPVIEHVPDSLGAWVKPIKNAAVGAAKVHACLALVEGVAKALKGRLTLVDAATGALNARTLGYSKK